MLIMGSMMYSGFIIVGIIHKSGSSAARTNFIDVAYWSSLICFYDETLCLTL